MLTLSFEHFCLQDPHTHASEIHADCNENRSNHEFAYKDPVSYLKVKKRNQILKIRILSVGT